MDIVSVRQQPACAEAAIRYFQCKWGHGEGGKMAPVYEECIHHCLHAQAPLPQWYLLMDGEAIAGCAGLIPNDFISRMELYPWVCALHIGEEYRGHGYGALLLEKAKQDTRSLGYKHLYLCTDHVGFYERYGFVYIGNGYHPFGYSSRIYRAEV